MTSTRGDHRTAIPNRDEVVPRLTGKRSARGLRAAWQSAHAPVPGVPQWARRTAHLIPFTVLPASIWRVAVCTFHAPIARGDIATTGGGSSGIPGLALSVYVVLLSIVSELLAFTAVGLVAAWGESFPRWVPVLHGRRVPPPAAAVPAACGAIVLTALWTWTAITLALGRRIDGRSPADGGPLSFHDWQGVLAVTAYAPLLLWGPLLGALTISYWRRRAWR
jgi:hypothetical protein